MSQDDPLSAVRADLAPAGVLRVGINMSNFLLVTGKTESGNLLGVSPSMAAGAAVAEKRSSASMV